MKSEKTVAIVGRPNVGKSALFNRLAGRNISIVHDKPGVTRDRITATCRRLGEPFTLIDTGGIGSESEDDFQDRTTFEAEIAIASADLILFVVDAREALTPPDQTLANVLRKSGNPVVLVANKVDTPKQQLDDSAFASLGFAESCNTSAEHNRGMEQLGAIIKDKLKLGERDEEEEANYPLKVALVGRPNVGKSSLINAIIEDERSIVSDVAGTTRDSIDVPFTFMEKDYLLIDTAGIRRRRGRAGDIEQFSISRAEKSIERSDICLLVIDAAQGVSAQDRKIARSIQNLKKPCIVILNKFDLYHPGASFSDRWEVLEDETARELVFLDYAPMVATSATKGSFLKKIFQAIRKVEEGAAKPLSTGELNRILQEALKRNPPPTKGGRRFNLLYAVANRAKTSYELPIPVASFILFGNRVKLIKDDYLRYLENKIRDEHPYTGLPISFSLKGKEPYEKRGLAVKTARGAKKFKGFKKGNKPA